MAYVPKCQHDVFVSYAHVDDELLPGISKGWVTNLIESLDVMVNRKVKSSGRVDIWMDHKLAGNAPLTETLTSTLAETATLLVVFSRRYMNSQWCEREREAFLDMVQDRSASRIFLVTVDRIPIDERPPQFRDIVGYDFWDVDRLSDAVRQFGVPEPSSSDEKYWPKLDDLARDMAAELDRLRDEADPPQPAKAEAERDSSVKVFLAAAAEDVMTRRDAVARSLDQAGFRVVPERTKSYPREADAYEAAVKADLADCSLFVQLLSELSGRSPFWSDLPQGFVRAQYDWACDTGTEILQWREPTLDVEQITDPEQKQLLHKPTVQAVGLEEFKQTAERKLRAIERVPVRAASVPAMVHVSAEEDDAKLTDAICNLLDQHEDEVGYDLDETDDLEYVRRCWDAIIFVYGEGKTERVGRRVRRWYKTLAGLGPRSLALYLGPPSGKARLGVKPPQMIKIDGREEQLNERGLLDFIAAVRDEKLRRGTDQGRTPQGSVSLQSC